MARVTFPFPSCETATSCKNPSWICQFTLSTIEFRTCQKNNFHCVKLKYLSHEWNFTCLQYISQKPAITWNVDLKSHCAHEISCCLQSNRHCSKSGEHIVESKECLPDMVFSQVFKIDKWHVTKIVLKSRYKQHKPTKKTLSTCENCLTSVFCTRLETAHVK
jgi:hypothetical protein